MKIKFVLLSLFVGANVATSMALSDGEGIGSAGLGGGLGVKSLDILDINDSFNLLFDYQIYIYSIDGTLVKHVSLSEFDIEIQGLKSGQYKAVYLDNSGNEVDQFYFSVE